MQLTRQGVFPTYVLQTCLALVRHYSWYLVLRLILFIGGQLLAGVYLSPRIMGRETGLHPVVVLVAILVGGTLFGLLGIVLAVPFTAVLQVVLHRWHQAWRATWPPPAAPMPPSPLPSRQGQGQER